MKSNFVISLFAVREALRMMVNKMLIAIEIEDLSRNSAQKCLRDAEKSSVGRDFGAESCRQDDAVLVRYGSDLSVAAAAEAASRGVAAALPRHKRSAHFPGKPGGVAEQAALGRLAYAQQGLLPIWAEQLLFRRSAAEGAAKRRRCSTQRDSTG